MHIHQRPVCCALPAGQSRGGWCAAPKPCVPARRETLLDVHSAPPWWSLNPPPVAMCRARVDRSYRQKTQASVHTFALRASCPVAMCRYHASCGLVKSQVLPVHSQVGSSPARDKTRRPSGHTALNCAVLRRRSCGHVHSQVREKTRTKPLKHLTAHVDPQPHVRPTTPD